MHLNKYTSFLPFELAQGVEPFDFAQDREPVEQLVGPFRMSILVRRRMYVVDFVFSMTSPCSVQVGRTYSGLSLEAVD